MKEKNAQVALEFMIVVGFISFAFVIFFMVIQSNMSDRIYERNQLKIEETASIIKNEIDLAHESVDGYYRVFNIPSEIYDNNYDIVMGEGILVVKSGDGRNAISVVVKEANGTITQGNNVIIKENGEVKINP